MTDDDKPETNDQEKHWMSKAVALGIDEEEATKVVRQSIDHGKTDEIFHDILEATAYGMTVDVKAEQVRVQFTPVPSDAIKIYHFFSRLAELPEIEKWKTLDTKEHRSTVVSMTDTTPTLGKKQSAVMRALLDTKLELRPVNADGNTIDLNPADVGVTVESEDANNSPLKQELDAVTYSLELADAKNNDAEKTIAAAEAKTNELQTINAELARRLSQATDTARQEVEAEIEELKNENNKLKHQLLLAPKPETESKLSEVSKALEAANAKNEVADQTLAAAEAKASELQTANAELARRLSEATEQARHELESELAGNVNELREALEVSNARNEVADETIAVAEAKTEELQDANAQLAKRLDESIAYSKEIESDSESDLEQVNQSLELGIEKLQVAEQTLAKAESKIKQLQAANAQLAQHLEETTEDATKEIQAAKQAVSNSEQSRQELFEQGERFLAERDKRINELIAEGNSLVAKRDKRINGLIEQTNAANGQLNEAANQEKAIREEANQLLRERDATISQLNVELHAANVAGRNKAIRELNEMLEAKTVALKESERHCESWARQAHGQTSKAERNLTYLTTDFENLLFDFTTLYVEKKCKSKTFGKLWLTKTGKAIADHYQANHDFNNLEVKRQLRDMLMFSKENAKEDTSSSRDDLEDDDIDLVLA